MYEKGYQDGEEAMLEELKNEGALKEEYYGSSGYV